MLAQNSGHGFLPRMWCGCWRSMCAGHGCWPRFPAPDLPQELHLPMLDRIESIKMLLYRSATALQCYSIVILQYLSAAALQCRSTTMEQHKRLQYHTAAVTQCYCITILEYQSIKASPCYSDKRYHCSKTTWRVQRKVEGKERRKRKGGVGERGGEAGGGEANHGGVLSSYHA